jgi:hypothetical protein
MRSGTCLLVAFALLAGAGAAHGGSPPRRSSTSVDIAGQPARSLEVADRPLGRRIAVFGRGPAARLPAPAGPMRPLAAVAADMLGHPGTLVLAKTRRVATPAGPVYLVPTNRGWVCVQGPTFRTCHRGLLRQGVTWNFYSTPSGLDVIGIAADDVRALTLTWGAYARRAVLSRNVFFVHRPLTITSAKHLPPLGRLVVAYRGSRAAATVSLH